MMFADMCIGKQADVVDLLYYVEVRPFFQVTISLKYFAHRNNTPGTSAKQSTDIPNHK
jgi:hypothetical protein